MDKWTLDRQRVRLDPNSNIIAGGVGEYHV